MAVAWLVEVDWDGDGVFGGEPEPQTLRKVELWRGRAARVRADGAGQQQPSDEFFMFEFYDPDGRYDGFNTSSPLYAQLGGAGQAVRLSLNCPATGGQPQPVFVGMLKTVQVRCETGMARLSGTGLCRMLMSGAAQSLWTECQPWLGGWDDYFQADGSTPFPVNYWRGRPGGLTVRQCAALTLARAGWPFGAYYGEGPGDTLQPDYFYFDGRSAWEILKDLADAFAARLFFLRDGRLFIMDRLDVSGLNAGGGAPSRAQRAQGLDCLGAFDSLRNTVRVNVRAHAVTPFRTPYLDAYYLEAWGNAGPLEVGPGQTIEMDARYRGGLERPLQGSFVFANANEYQVWSAADKSGTRMDASGGMGQAEFSVLWEVVDGNTVPYGNQQSWTRVRFRNYSATLTAYFFNTKVMMIGIRETGLPVVCQAQDAAGLAQDGLRTLTIDSRWVQTAQMGAAVAESYAAALSRRESASPAAVTYQWSGELLAQNLLAHDLGTHVNFGAQNGTAALNNFGMWGRWLVVGQKLEWLSAGGQDARVKLTFEKAADDLLPVVLEGSTLAAGALVSSVSFTHPVQDQPNRLLLVLVSLRAYQVVNAVTIGGQALARHAEAQAGTGNNPRVELWYLAAPPVGVGQVVVTLSGAEYAQACAISLHHAHQATPLGAAKTGGAGNSPASLFPVTGAAGDLFIDGLGYANSAGDANPGYGQTALGTVSSDGSWKLSASHKAGAAAVTMSWSPTGGAWAQVAVAVKAGSG